MKQIIDAIFQDYHNEFQGYLDNVKSIRARIDSYKYKDSQEATLLIEKYKAQKLEGVLPSYRRINPMNMSDVLQALASKLEKESYLGLDSKKLVEKQVLSDESEDKYIDKVKEVVALEIMEHKILDESMEHGFLDESMEHGFLDQSMEHGFLDQSMEHEIYKSSSGISSNIEEGSLKHDSVSIKTYLDKNKPAVVEHIFRKHVKDGEFHQDRDIKDIRLKEDKIYLDKKKPPAVEDIFRKHVEDRESHQDRDIKDIRLKEKKKPPAVEDILRKHVEDRESHRDRDIKDIPLKLFGQPLAKNPPYSSQLKTSQPLKTNYQSSQSTSSNPRRSDNPSKLTSTSKSIQKQPEAKLTL